MAGSISAYSTAAGTRYRVRYRKPNGASTDKRGFTTKKEARLYLASVEVSKATGDYIDPADSRVTIAHLGTSWLASKSSLKPSSKRALDSSWEVYVKPRWGDTPVGAIKPSHVEQWITELGEGRAVTAHQNQEAKGPRSATVVLRAVGVLAGILDVALRDQRIRKNPARGAQNLPRKHSQKTRRYLTDKQVVKLAQSCDTEQHATLVLLLAYCGLRWSEAIGLRVRDVNPLRGRVHINRAAVEVASIIEVGAPKTWEKRTVPFPKFLAKPLADLTEGKEADDLVFCSASGDYLRRPRVDRTAESWFASAVAKAKLERLTPHDLRHTAASLAISAGANVKAVQRMLGHASAAMTLDTYADLFDDDLDDIATRLDKRAVKADVGKTWARAA